MIESMAQRMSCFWRWESRWKSRSDWTQQTVKKKRQIDVSVGRLRRERFQGKKTHLVDLDGRILRDDTRSTTRCVEQDSVETTHDLWELTTVVVANDDVLAAESVDVGRQRLGPGLVAVVGKDETGVLEEGGDVRRLSSGSGGHVEDTLSGLRGKGHDGKEGGGGLKHVVTGEVLGGGTDGNGRLEDLESDLGPLSDGLEVDSSGDERLSKITSSCAEGVGSDGDGSGGLVGVEEGDGLGEGKELQELLDEELVVAVVGRDVRDKLFHVVGSRSGRERGRSRSSARGSTKDESR